MIDTSNDEVRVYEMIGGEFGWRRVDLGNGRIVSRSSGGDAGGYADHEYAVEAACAYNPGIRIVDFSDPEGVVVIREAE